jgi:maleylpyruvate isomerase
MTCDDRGMSEPTTQLHALRSSTADLVKGLLDLQWSDADVVAPSLLPGWTRGHVLTHIARNADGIADTLAGALRGEIVPRYPGGTPGRNADIEAGASRHYAALVTDVRDSADRLDRVFAAIADAGGWDLLTEHEDPAGAWTWRRWREVEIHRVDLASDYTPDRWPASFVTLAFEEAAPSLDSRVEGAVHVEVAGEGSLSPDLVDRSWTVGSGEPVVVRGPDWAVLAWMSGRAVAAGDALSAAPELAPWR